MGELRVLFASTLLLLVLLNDGCWVTGQGGSDVPQNFTVSLNGTILMAAWDPPPDQTVSSYTLSCSVEGTVVLSLETSLVNVTLGVYRTSATYTCSVYATTEDGDGSPTDGIAVTTGDSSVEAYLPFIPRVSDENIITTGDDVDRSSNINVTFPFGSSSFTVLYVGSNGIISFGSSFNGYSNQAISASFTGRYLVAPFWDDINLNVRGNISYETFESGYYLEQVNAYIQRQRSTNFEGTWMMNVYYKGVGPYGGGSGENTFQAILVTDETYSYTIFIYKCGLMEWDNGATIGYTANANPYAQHNPSSRSIACLNSPDSDWSNVLYRLSVATPEDQPPEDLSSDAGSSSATISWKVESTSATQEYVVNYGTNEDSLNLTSATVQSVSDISAVNQTYEVDLTSLSLDTTYYYQVVATTRHFTLESDTASFTTSSLAPSGAPENFEATLNGTVATFTWDPPEDDEQNGNIVSYILSCSVDSELQFELNLTDIEEISVGVYEIDATYTCEISASTLAGEGPTATLTVSTGGSGTAVYLPFLPIGDLYNSSNEEFLTTGDDLTSDAISIPVDFPFADTVQTRVYVGSNGIISFGSSAYNTHTNAVFSSSFSRYVIAPYWDDININNGGTISYETIESGYFLEQVNTYLQRKFPTNFEATWMMVAYYDRVEPYTGSGENTFQAIIVTDGMYTYTIFTYKCGLLEWDNGVTIGYSAAGDPFDNHDSSSDEVACDKSPDSDWNNVVYLLSEESPQVTISNVTASFVGTSTTTVSWVVSYIPEQLEFIVYYGTDEDSLDRTSNTVTSSDDTSLVDEEYEVTLTGLSLGVTYYFMVEATYSNFTIESDVEEFTTNELAPSGTPKNFTAALNGTVVLLTWDPPSEDERNGEIISYFLSCYIDNDLVFEVNMTDIQEIYLGVYEHESNYTCNLSASTSEGTGPAATDSFLTGDYSDPAHLPFIPLGTLYENANDVNLRVADDVASSAITLPTEFPFADVNQTTAYVGSNGIVSFGSSAYNPFSNTQLPGSSSNYFIAPYWDDINIVKGGSIRYEIFESGYFLEKVNEFIMRVKPASFEGTWMLVASYEEVQPYSGSGENTFQAIIASDGIYSYAIFTYKCGLMDWDSGVTIGYSAGGDPYDSHDPSSSDIACVNSPDSDWSNVVYQLSEGSPEDPPAEDITITNVTNVSAVVSWTVLFISSAQEYVVEYGEDEDNFNETSETLSVADTTLVDQTYSVTLSGLTRGALYYVRVATTNAENVTFYSDTESFRTVDLEPIGAPRNFVVSVEKTTLTFEWDPPADDEIEGTLVSYTLACADDDSEDEFVVDLNVIEKITVDEFLPSTTYTCTLLASTNGGDGPTASVTATTENSTDIYLQFLDLDALLDVEETVLPAADDSATGPISIDTGFPFGDTNQTSFYIGTNGIISFGSSAYNPFSNSEFPVTGSLRYVVAPYWDDIDTRFGNGAISYEIHTSGFYLDQVNTFIAHERSSDFQGTWMAVIFYSRVRPYPASSSTEENSFQVILITDGTYSYSVFTYNCERTEWDNDVTIGFNGGEDFYENHDPSSSEIACLNYPDSNWTNVVYLLSNDSPEVPSPDNIEISRLRTTSFTISWNIPSFVEAEEYIVEYGLEVTELNMTSSTVESESDTSLVNQTYSVNITDLEVATIYHMRVLAQYGIDSLDKRYSDIYALRTLEEEQIAYLPFINYTDTYISSGVVELCDDCTSENISLSIDFPFGQYIHTNAYIGTDGWIAFGRSVEDSEPELFPSTSADIFWTFIVAPFWGNLSTVEGGMVAWEIHNDSSSPDLFDRVNSFITDEYGDSYFNGTWMLIAFWEDVSSSDGNFLNNTFQAVLVTNSTKSYAIFTYKCGELDFLDTAVIGYNIPLGDYDNHPLSDANVPADAIACVHLDSVWNNVVYDLQPDGNTVFTGTPEPSQFIGSCIDAGYTECCTGSGCSGTPDDCYCDTLCYGLNDCCYDIDTTCPNSTVEEYDILVANGEYIHQVHYEGDDVITFESELLQRVSGIDYIYNSSVIFWSDTTQDKIYRASLNGSDVEELINSSIRVVDDIAVDWVSNKLYWVDAVWARIEVLDLETYYRAEVLRIGPNTLPRAIAVDPESRFMFWTDWANDAKIERSFMDGNDRRTIVNTSLSQPNGITIDYMTEKIYWSDSDLDKIEYSNYDGTSRTTLETAASGLRYPFSLTVVDDLLFWSDWNTNKLYVTHKVHGSDSNEGYFATVALFSSSPYGIEALLSTRQQPADDPCTGSNCSHICLPNDLETGFSCVCAEGYGIESDGLSCKKLDATELPPSEGSCLEAGYNSSDTCCSSGHCSGIPVTCSCDLECYERGDCCSDISDSCTEGIPMIPTNVTTDIITAFYVNISWIISSVAITQETYTVYYGRNMSDLDLTSESLDSRGQTLTDQLYSVVLDNLEGDVIYYYQVVAENEFSSSISDIYSFTTLEGVPTEPPVNFTVEVNMTTLICSWGPPPMDAQNGNLTSYTLFCMVDDELVFNENLSYLVESFSIDLYSLNTTYNCSVYASTEIGAGPPSDYVTVRTTDDANFLMVLPFISIADTYNFEVVTLDESDDGGSDRIPIPESVGFVFGNRSQTSVYIGTNGLISFGSFYNSFSNERFPDGGSDRYLVAPFWDDIDIRQGNGEITYEIHNSGYYVDHVSAYIRAVNPSEFQGMWMLVAYWDAVHPYLGSSNPEENTFQAVCITDGSYSYTVFTYKCGLMEWDNGVTIGFNAADGRYDNNDPSSSDVACEYSPDSVWSNVIYRLSDDSPEYPSPDYVEVSDITEDSACVSWTVDYVLERQEYYIVYGVDEDTLNLTSYSIQGHSNTSFTDQTYNITLTGLMTGIDYYMVVIAEYGSTVLYSDTISFSTLNIAPTGPPLNYKVIPKGTGLYFRWNAPAGGVSILSYTITCYISSELAISVTLNPVNSVTLDEFMPSTTYTCSMYSSSTGGDGPSTFSVNVTTEDDTGDIYLPFLSLDAIYGAEQVFLNRVDDGTSNAIDTGGDDGFPFGDSVQTQLYVGTNGLLSFGSAYNAFSNQEFPGDSGISSRYLVAPFWDDIDISRDQMGQISYEVHQSGYYLDQVNYFLSRKRPSTFNGTWMFVVYWDSVRPYPGSSNTAVNSFQAILITDGIYSYSIFTYDCNTTEWGDSVTIGYSAAGNPYENHDPSSSDIACLNSPYSNITNVIYLLSDDNPELPPPDATDLDVLLTSVTVNWTVPYIIEEEEYYIIYGFETDELDMTSDSIQSVVDTSLENQTYSLHVEGLESGTVYYAQVVATFGEFKRYSDSVVFRTKEAEQAAYLEFLPHTDTSIDSATLRSCDDCTSFAIPFPDAFPFGGYFHNFAYVSTNGLVSFGFGRSFTGRSPVIFPSSTSDVFWRYIAAAFWADWDTVSGGSVSWEIHNRTESQDLLESVDELIQIEYGDTNFNGSWMLVSFWENVTETGSLFENTFQEILITNGTKSYAVYTYKCGELEWSSDATIGVNAPPDGYYNHPLTLIDVSPDEIACVHLDSVWNNVILDLEPNPVILPLTPAPSSFIGSCAAAGFTECCTTSCSGFPSDCMCDDFCRQLGDCCYDIDDTCPEGNTTDFDIIVANGLYIHQVHYQGNSSDTFVTNSSGKAIGIDFHYEQETLFWSDVENDVIYQLQLNESDEFVLVDTNINVVDDIAVDWVSNKLYWVDAAWARIEVLDLQSLYRAEVLRVGPNTNPRAIAVEPYMRFMFWTDWGENPKIEQAFMDGSGRRTIVNSYLSQPNAVTVDYISNKIYWADSDLDKIEYSNYDGSERRSVETEETGLLYPFGLTVAGDILFWSDWGTNTVYATHKEHGANTSEGYFTEIAVFTSIPYGIEALDPDRQYPANNTCDGNGCSHICLMSDIGYTCVCPYGYSLESDQMECKADNTTGSGGGLLEGSCVDAGYNDSCCQHGYCAGYPFTCFCDRECYSRGDCCVDIVDICPEGDPATATNVMVLNITGTSAVVMWTIPSVAFTFEQYRVYYGNHSDSLYMTSEIVYGTDLDAVNKTYTVELSGLKPLSTYYYQIVSANSESELYTTIMNFTADEDAPSGPPTNFTIAVDVTSLMCMWGPPEEDLQNGEIVSYTLFCYSGSRVVIDLSLNPTVLEISVDLFSHSTAYSCSVAASTTIGIGPYTDTIDVTTEALITPLTYLPFITLDVEYGSDTTILPESDDGTSSAILLPSTYVFPFGDSLQTQFYVGTNGLISFNSSYNSYSNQPFPGSVSLRYLVAPFWDDVDTRGGNGVISYETYTYTSGYFLDHVSAFIRRQRPSTFQGTWMAVAYWDAVHPYFGATSTEENTFQALLITDGTYSYAVFTYMCGLLEWGDSATIGFNAPGEFYDNYSPSYPDIDCVNQPASVWSNVIYLLSNDSSEFEGPRDITVSNITEASANVSWIIPSVTEMQDYYLLYGTDRSNLSLVTNTIPGNTNISIVNETYSIALQNLETGTVYYVAIVAVSGSTTIYSDIESFTTLESAPEGPPANFAVIADGISLHFSWDRPVGDQMIISFTLTCSVDGDIRFSAQFKEIYEIALEQLIPSTNYSCSVYASTSGGDGPPTNEISALTENITRNDVYLPFIPTDVTYGVEEIVLAQSDEGISNAISIPIGFPFGDSVQNQFYVGTNGILSFGSAYGPYSNRAFPDFSRYLVAPFWDDVDTTGGSGRISYEIHRSGYFLEQVNTYLNIKRPSDFKGTWMAVVYYDSVHPWIGTLNQEENTFQVILITDGIYSYTIFVYKCGLMEWDTGATIGFNAAGDPYANHDPSTADVACLNMMYTNWSNVEYLLSIDSPEIPVPQDVAVTEITTVEAVVSWIIPSFTTPEMYYVQYGEEEDVLDMTTMSISSPTDTALVNQTYSIRLQGLSPSTVYFLRVVAVYDIISLRYSDQTSFRTYDEEQVAYLPFLNHTDSNIDSGQLNSCDNCTSVEIFFPESLPFGGYYHQSAYVGTDGLISFGRTVESSPELFPSTVPEVYWSYILAPFWADMATTVNGTVSWELHDAEGSRQLLNQVNTFIRTIEGVNFTGTLMLVAFWEDIDIYANTFQAIIITNGINSYSVYTYKCGELSWPGSAVIGFNAPLMDYTNDPFSGDSAVSIACTHLISPWKNVVYDLQAGSVILPTTPEPSSFIGSCVEAGYSECCEESDCFGSPDDCFCDTLCIIFQDCCYDFLDICPTTLPYDVLVAVGPSLATVHYEGTDSFILRTNFSETTLAVDFNYEYSKVYWSHTDLEYSVPATIYCANLNGSEEQILVDTNILFVSDIAMDWIAGHLYWVDSSWARIEAMDLDNLNRTEVIRTGPNTNPSAITVDPLRRYMFWSDLGIMPQIERAFMDGDERRTIISSGISRPVGVTIDYTQQRIYWSDVDLDRIEYCDYDGSNRFVVETEASGLLYPFALTVADDLLFWTDWVTDSLYVTHKEHGSDSNNGYFQTVATFSSDPYGIEALLEGRQEPGQNPCKNSTCTHICLLSGTDDRGYVCVCPEGYQMEPDSISCKALNDSDVSPPAEGSCVDAGYTSCCTHGYCAGYPPTCSCHPECTLGTFGCCSDFEIMCPPVPPLTPVDITVNSVNSNTVLIEWTVRRTPFGFETYNVEYGLTSDSLDMQSDITAGSLDSTLQNETYSVLIQDLQPFTTYHYRMVAKNLAGETTSDVDNFTTLAVMTSSAMVVSTVSSETTPTTTVAEQPTITTNMLLPMSSLTSSTIVSTTTSVDSSSVQSRAPTYNSMQTTPPPMSSLLMRTSTYSSMQMSGSVARSVVLTSSAPTPAASSSENISGPISSSRLVTSPSQTLSVSTASAAIPSVQQSVSTSPMIGQSSSSLLATSSVIVSSQQQTSSTAIPSLIPTVSTSQSMGQTTVSMGQTTVSMGQTTVSVGQTTVSMGQTTVTPSQTTVGVGVTTVSMRETTASVGTTTTREVTSSPTTTVLPPSTTTSPSPTQQSASVTPSGVPVETKIPDVIKQNLIKITLGDYNEKNFTTLAQQNFRQATAEVVNECCTKVSCATITIKRSTNVVESKDVIFTDITDTNMGVSVVMYVLMNNDEVLDGDALLSCIQNASSTYKKYNFDAVMAERVTVDDTGKSGEGLSAGGIAGIVIGLFIVVAVVVATAAYIFYHIRKRGLYKVTGLVGGFDEPMTDKFFEFGNDDKNSEIFENPGYAEKEV